MKGERDLEDLRSAPWQSPRTSGKPIEEFCSAHGTKGRNCRFSRLHGPEVMRVSAATTMDLRFNPRPLFSKTT